MQELQDNMKVFVGMSGGVDSSLTAALLIERGHNVTGVYMKNWSQDLPGMKCPWADDLADAKRVAVQLGIDLKVYDFEKEYRENVVEYMISAYSQGYTPNPDIMCNQEVKFKLFLETALADGADMIATGHYATTRDNRLFMASDANKDQTYFLYRVTSQALSKTFFPLGEYTKQKVRQMSENRRLFTAKKKDSQGICFVGKIGIREFLSQYVDTKPGDIIAENNTSLDQREKSEQQSLAETLRTIDLKFSIDFLEKSQNNQKSLINTLKNGLGSEPLLSYKEQQLTQLKDEIDFV